MIFINFKTEQPHEATLLAQVVQPLPGFSQVIYYDHKLIGGYRLDPRGVVLDHTS